MNEIFKSPASNQGKKFKKYQKKVLYNLEKTIGKEGFTGLTEQTNNLIQSSNISNQQPIIDNLRQEYDNTLKAYQTLMQKITGNASDYINRVNPDNPYLNKVVQFTTGENAYVTNQGVVKLIPSSDVWQTLNVPQSVNMKLNIPWKKSYNKPGTTIETTPTLISGTVSVKGQSFGNEGSNVFVNQLLPSETSPSYMGCYATSSNNDNMTFIGGSPPSIDITIKNGNFIQPVLSNNTYQYINDSTTVPGWTINNAALLNNSNDWQYPIPYPNGNQCISLQKTTSIQQTVKLNANTNYTLSFNACGRDCCDGSNTGNQITINLYDQNMNLISNIYEITPPINEWTEYSVTFTVSSNNTYILYFAGTTSDTDRSSAIQGITLGGSDSSNGSYSYKSCMQSAIQQGYQYFALQNVNTQTATGYCAVSNSSPAVTQYGQATIPTKLITLWSSNTSGQGNTATLSNTGSLQVLNSSGQVIYSSPASTASSTYIGCYTDNSSSPAMQDLSNNNYMSFDDCRQLAQNGSYAYFATQNASNGNGLCYASNNLSDAQQYGVASNCTTQNNNWMGGPSSNAIYSVEAGGNYFIVLQSDGNLCVYRGSSPQDNQGGIWCTMTNGQLQDQNPNMVATKGKYGQNWMPSGGTLASGDFIGSDDGSMSLVMRPDGNLVLYAYEMTSNCQTMSDGNMGGGIMANAAYDIGMVADPNNIGQLAYIDGNSDLYAYPTNNSTYSNEYKVTKNYNTSGNDINGTSYSGATVDSCKNTCNSNSECAGFVFDNNNGICYPKTNNMYPYSGSIESSNGVDIYLRNQIPNSPPSGVSQKTKNIDTIQYNGYSKGGNMKSSYGLATSNSAEKQILDQLKSKLDMLSNQMNNLNSQFKTNTNNATNQSSNNITEINKYIDNIKHINKKTQEISNGGIDNILNDSDIVVLQKNYNYLFWSILATGTILISMNILNK